METAGGDGRRGLGFTRTSLSDSWVGRWSHGGVQEDLKVLWANPIKSVDDETKPRGMSTAAQVGGRGCTVSPSCWRPVEAQTLNKWLCSHTATPGSCSIHGPQKLFVPDCPLPPGLPPPKKQTEQLWRRISHAPHNARQTHRTKAPGVAIWNSVYRERACE